MRRDKGRIEEMRRNGMSYREIQKQTGVSRATLTKWFGNKDWSQVVSDVNATAQSVAARNRIVQMNLKRQLKLQEFYSLQEQIASDEFLIYRNETLFWAGLMIYAGEGDKRTKHVIRVSNSEAYIHYIFIQFLERYLQVSREDLRYGLLLYGDHAEENVKAYWMQKLGMTPTQFHKTQFLQGKEPVKRLQNGVCITIITNTGLKKKLLTWLSLIQKETEMRL